MSESHSPTEVGRTLLTAVSCPYCGHVEHLGGLIVGRVRQGWAADVLLLATEGAGTTAIEHHCPVLKEAVSRQRERASQSGESEGR